MAAIIPTTPEHALTTNAPEFLPPPLRAVRHILDFVQWRFSTLPAGAYRWVEEQPGNAAVPSDSEIFIGSDRPVKAGVVGARPAITVSRAAISFQGSGIGDQAFTDLRTGAKAYMDIIPTTIIISVLSRIPFVSERLAWFVAEQIFTWKEIIVKTERCILYTGSRMMVSPPGPAGAAVDTVADHWSLCTISLPMFLQHNTARMPLNTKILRKVGTTFAQIQRSAAPQKLVATLQP